MKNKKKSVGIIIAGVIVMAAVATGMLAYYNSDSVRLRRQLDLGNRYLAELNFEEAIVAYEAAIAIEPVSVEAYLGLADAYLGLGDAEQALAALERGYEVTGDERLKERIDEIKALEEDDSEQTAPVEDGRVRNDARETRIDEIGKILYDAGMTGVPNVYTRLLTFDQIKVSYTPLAEELEGYLDKECGNWEINAWDYLAKIYLHMGEMEKCLETRRRGYEATGWETLRTEPYEAGNGYATDEYGRIIATMAGDNYTYWNADCVAVKDDAYASTPEGDIPYVAEYEYDSGGRIISYSEMYSGDIGTWAGSWDKFSYDHQGDNTAIVSWSRQDADMNEHLSIATLVYDEYGIPAERSLSYEYQY